ncbi:hypothetical protein NPIL_681891 [Nephila pilipes]|uniref:Uncharacterized protein n=1 Tax=Nephila pilipes TaxID=299642 RepID=A0A8X6TSM5_NEPPI|nr:hypothetical protein NPIL_681891 [Nephila pilipes]
MGFRLLTMEYEGQSFESAFAFLLRYQREENEFNRPPIVPPSIALVTSAVMPHPCSNAGRHSRNTIIGHQRKSNRTDHEHLDDNEHFRVRISRRCSEELAGQRG